MNRHSEALPSCPSCGSAAIRTIPSQAHPYLCLNCGDTFGLDARWGERRE